MLSLKGVDRVDRELLEYFKTVLNDQKKSLLVQANQTVSHDVIKERDHLSDYADIASSESDRTFHLRIRDRERKLIKKIDQALERINDGTFGLCERCGEEIDSDRLKARPVTTYCIDCKTKLEKEEIE
jgi:DnaK suppressor protein